MSLYELMGVAETASKQEIKQAYRKLALQLHPDKHSQSSEQTRDAAAEKFKQVSAAYETLVDDRKRADYDERMANATQTHQHDERRDYPHNAATDTAGESRTNENRHGGGTNGGNNTKSDNKKEKITWFQLFWRVGLVIIVGSLEEVWHSSVRENECETLRKNHEAEIEKLQKIRQESEEVVEHGTRWRERYEVQVNHGRQLEELRKRHQRQLEEHRERHDREWMARWRRRLHKISE